MSPASLTVGRETSHKEMRMNENSVQPDLVIQAGSNFGSSVSGDLLLAHVNILQFGGKFPDIIPSPGHKVAYQHQSSCPFFQGFASRLPVLGQEPEEGSAVASVTQIAQRAFGLLATSAPGCGALVWPGPVNSADHQAVSHPHS